MEAMLNFDDIRPYDDRETAEAMQRIANAVELKPIADFLFGSGNEEVLREKLRNVTTVDEFQLEVMAKVVASIVEKTSDGLEVEGLEHIKSGCRHVIVSNHRDIILDPAIMQLIFAQHGVSTTEIAVGDNLIANDFIEDAFRSNRMIKVVRGGTPREKYMFSKHLSDYIRDAVVSDRCSVWIAQKSGRAKNGVDETSQGLLKMFEMSGSGDFVSDFDALSILPLSVSYQFESCDFLKARELYISRQAEYVKRPGEDTESILTGVTQRKGKIAFHFSAPITGAELNACAELGKNERFQALAALIDTRIHSNYKLWDNNYIAADILSGTKAYSAYYTEESRMYFTGYMEKGLAAIVTKEPSIDIEELRNIFLSIYSAPVAVCHTR